MNFFINILWSLSGTIGVRIAGLLTSIFLASLLTPGVFGIVGMALVVVGFLYVIQEAGLSSVIVQKKDLTKSILSTAFFLNIIFSIILVILVIAAAPSIARFYHQPSIENLLYYSSAGIIIASVSITQRGLLMRNKQFKKLTLIDLSAEILTGVLSILLAFLGYPILAVGLSMLFRAAIQSFFLLLLVGIKDVVGKPDFRLIKVILPFSINVLGTRVVNFVRNNIDYLLIGKMLGSYSLGLYTIAFQWSTVARFYFSQSIANVAFPEVAKYQNDYEKVGKIYLNLIKNISFVTFPFCIGMALVAPEFILALYKEKWVDVIPILQILMIAGLISSIGTVVGAILKGIGRPDIELKINFYSLISFTILLLLGSTIGLKGVAYAVLINSFTFNIVMTIKVLKILHLSLSDYLNSLKNSLLSTIFMSAIIICYSLADISFNNRFIELIIIILVCILSYAAGVLLFNRPMYTTIISKLDIMKKKFKILEN
ncbi:lipopolysaccharide biosynthesis protein [Fictibacillus barbaricus]|uniref:PST family polysaccharide transporter n=1 Tax=Fictibacillus barbaricus TaxID=182136 RepID=A0ABU1U154_9BACL|nr:lipopolysaccharide biosynthesis protein [Fictibacillus barbaricus]MDR7073185.1 PST family polysaccharide transporter [Fictibacillus barbaricus]